MDPEAYQVYKNQLELRIAKILSEALSKGVISADQSDEMATYILNNIDLAKTNGELFAFIESLSVKWPIFNSILTSPTATPDQAQVPSPAVNQVGEKKDQIIQTAENLIKENKLDEALQVTKTAIETPVKDQQVKTGGILNE
jgi:hypothetical protein